MIVKTEILKALRVNAPEFFLNEEFVKFLEGKRPFQCGCRPATWHQKGEPTENSDTFVIFDHGDGSDRDVIPEEIWEEICKLCEQEGFEYGIIWLTNCEEIQ